MVRREKWAIVLVKEKVLEVHLELGLKDTKWLETGYGLDADESL